MFASLAQALRLPSALRLPLALRLALRELRGGFSGLYVLVFCLALGVAAIVGVGALSLSLRDGLAREGAAILGGDLAVELVQRAPNGAERALIEGAGRVSEIVMMRAMARAASGEAAMVEIKAVDSAYPLAGALALDPPEPPQAALAAQGGVFGVAVDPALPPRLGLRLGDVMRIGEGRYRLEALVTREPDELASGIGFGPRVLMSMEGLEASGLARPGALFRHVARVALPQDGRAPASDAAVRAAAQRLRAAAPEAGWEIRTRDNVSPQFSRNLDRFSQFLTLIGLAALIVGGVGVANAAEAYALRKRRAVAALKTLGAGGSFVFSLMLTEVMLVALAGVALGAALGSAFPFVAAGLFGALLPFPLAPAVHPAAIAEGALYGLLTAFAFSVRPLGRAHDAPAQAVFRESVEDEEARPRLRYRLLALGAAALLAGSALALSDDRRIALVFVGAILAAYGLMRLAAAFVTAGARRAGRLGPAPLRLALASVRRPGALAPALLLSLGLGLALIVALALVDAGVRADLASGRGGKTPSFFFLDVPGGEAEAFAAFVKARAPQAELALAPMLRGRITRLAGRPAEAAKPGDSAAWALQGDRGLTFADAPPPGSTVVKGEWWPKDYAGPPLVSLEDRVAEGLGLDVGDEISVNVLGRTLTARVASLRKVQWRGMGLNFVLVFSPGAFAGAPYNMVATLTPPAGASPETETALSRALAAAWPSVTSVRVKEALDAAGLVVDKLAAAVRAASAFSAATAILALAGAIGARQSARAREAAILKTLGATRGRILAAAAWEFGLLGAAAALAGALIGAGAAFAVARWAMDLDFSPDWRIALAAAFAALAAVLALGLAASLRALSLPPAPVLREL
ncbi:ABC transporter permease [Methylocella sp.]|uniref:ABC transporter permease n=1 Tax=Methylocella sp. TaxID=1978226 RepID=UPI003783CBDE